MNAGGLVGGIIGGALQAGVMGWFRSGGVNITVVSGGQGYQVGTTSRSIAMGILSGAGAAIFDAGCALLGGVVFEALGMDALEGANLGMALGAMAQTALQYISIRTALNEVTSVGRNLQVVLGYGRRGSRSGGSLPSEHSLAFRDGAGTIHERRQSYERRTGGDEGVAGTRGRETGVVNADEQCNLFVFRTELDGSSSMLKACLAAGTPIVVNHDGQSIAIEQLRPGDWILSRSEHNPNGPLELKQVQEVFVRTGKIFALTVDGRVIKTTGEHPFWIVDLNEWVHASKLKPGNKLLTPDGKWATVEEVKDTGEFEAVYNVSVEDYHSYFIGSAEWGWSVWAHNMCTPEELEYYKSVAESDAFHPMARLAAKHIVEMFEAGYVHSNDPVLVRVMEARGLQINRQGEMTVKKTGRVLTNSEVGEVMGAFEIEVAAIRRRLTQAEPLSATSIPGLDLSEYNVFHYTSIDGVKGMNASREIRTSVTGYDKHNITDPVVWVTPLTPQQIIQRGLLSRMGLTNEKAAFVIPLKLPPGTVKSITGGRGEYVKYVTQNIPLPARGSVAIRSGIGG